MKNLIKLILGLIVLGIVLFFLGKYSALKMVTWLCAIVGIVIGTAAMIFLDVNWGKFLDHTL